MRRQDAAGLNRAHGRRRIRRRPPGDWVYIAQVTLYFAPQGVAISQACYAIGENHERAVLKTAAGRAGSGGCADSGGCSPCAKAVFWQLQEQGADFLLTV
jgi:hypothetical protein